VLKTSSKGCQCSRRRSKGATGSTRLSSPKSASASGRSAATSTLLIVRRRRVSRARISKEFRRPKPPPPLALTTARLGVSLKEGECQNGSQCLSGRHYQRMNGWRPNGRCRPAARALPTINRPNPRCRNVGRRRPDRKPFHLAGEQTDAQQQQRNAKNKAHSRTAMQ
jgi:hypothetical protein